MTRLQRNTKRRAVYQYYRSCGYGPKIAANMRGRREAVWTHYYETGKKEGRKAPVLKSSKAEKASIRKELRETYGLSAKVAYQWTKIKEKTLQLRLVNLRKYVKAVQQATGKTKAEVRKIMAKQLTDIDTQRKFWREWREFYDGIVGFPG